MKQKGKSLREQKLEQQLRGMTNLYEDEHRKNLELQNLYENLKENFHQLAMMKVSTLAGYMARMKKLKAVSYTKKAP